MLYKYTKNNRETTAIIKRGAICIGVKSNFILSKIS